MSTTELATRNNTTGLARFVAENEAVNLAGDMLLFKKGEWSRAGNAFVPGTQKFLVNVEETYTGWTKWLDGKPEQHEMSRLIEYQGAIPRQALGDMDKNQWAVNDRGVPVDPWQPSDRMVLRTTDKAEELLTFVSSSKGGRNAIAKLIGKVAKNLNYTDDKMFPIITLHSSSYDHDDYGIVYVPEFKVVDWAYWEPTAPKLPSPSELRAVLDDEIPF